jgi:uncharacterized membrane protein
VEQPHKRRTDSNVTDTLARGANLVERDRTDGRRRGCDHGAASYQPACLVLFPCSAMREENVSAGNVSVPYGKGIRVEKSIEVNAPPEEVYRFWRNFENFPRFMENLEWVRVIDDTRSRWRVKGPAHIDAEWEAEIINEVPNELIAWRSLNGSNVDNAGSVHFRPTDRGTEVKVEFLYHPPAGRVGAGLAKLLGEDPEKQVEEDLRRFKALVEMRR